MADPAPDLLLAQVTEPAANSLAAAARELVGPLTGTATPEPLPWDDASTPRVTVPAGTRYPLLLVTVTADTGRDEIIAVPRALAPTPAATQPGLTFSPWSQAGSSLPGYVPPVDADGAAPGVRLALSATLTTPDGAVTTLAADEVRARLRVDLVQGVTGRVLAAVLGEKVRLRRCAREVAAMRVLADARGEALDRLGTELGCVRFSDELFWDPERRSPATRPLSPPGRREDDSQFRTRLRLLRGWRLPTPTWAEGVLDDPAEGVGPVEVDEGRNAVHVAFRLVAPAAAIGRVTLLDSIRQVHLVWPAGSADGDTAHAGRLLPQRVQQRVEATREALAHWSVPDHQPLAPSLATALELLDARCGQLGARPWPAVVAGQSDDGGSRFELGLGALLAPPNPAAVDAAVAAAVTLGDPALVPQARSIDPAASWLTTACGLRTTEQLPDGTVFVATVPTGPLVVDLAPGPDAAVPIAATAHLAASSDAAHDAPLAVVVAALAARQLPVVDDVGSLLAGMQPASVAPDLAAALATLGVPLATQVVGFRRQLTAVPPREYAVIDLGAAGTAAVTADATQIVATLAAAAASGASSVVGFLTAATTVALALGVTGLPLAGSNLAARQTVLYRWEARGLAGRAVQLDPRRGSSTVVFGPGEGISMLSCLVHVRGGGNDPYEWSPRLPEAGLLTLAQYEHLMNLVELTTPVGVRANTWDLRQHHVDVDGSGRPFPLTAAAARTYRHYHTAG